MLDPFRHIIFISCVFNRELEKTCADLGEALKKRFPDSTASLLYAASSAGIGANPAELDATRRENASLKNEIESNRVEYDIKLRALRQEYEKMRIEYEVKLKKSIGDASGSTRSSIPKHRESSDNSSATSGIRSMNQALQKIRHVVKFEVMMLFSCKVLTCVRTQGA
jgi:hypothetical protein